jgi:hypothetical protein
MLSCRYADIFKLQLQVRKHLKLQLQVCKHLKLQLQVRKHLISVESEVLTVAVEYVMSSVETKPTFRKIKSPPSSARPQISVTTIFYSACQSLHAEFLLG